MEISIHFLIISRRSNVLEMWPQKTVWRMRIACRIPTTTNTHCIYTAIMVTRTRLNVTLHYTACLVENSIIQKYGVLEIPEIDKKFSLYV
jgi:hypothetical protein